MRVSTKQLQEILEKHKKWLMGEAGGDRADMHNTDLYGANLYGSDLETDINLLIPQACPDTGTFIGWKKCREEKIVKLRIPETAKRSSATGRKCRCDNAEVLAIENTNGTPADTNCVRSCRDYAFIYRVGEMVFADNFDENRWNECAPGIHFFITREEAVNYI